MKIRRVTTTVAPHPHNPDYQILTIEVHTDCGQLFTTQDGFKESHFQDIFSILMKNAERCIRDMVAGKITP